MSKVSLENSINKSPKKIAFGLSLGSLALLERLKARNHADLIFMSHASAASLDKKSNVLKYSTPLDFLKDYWQSNNKLIPISEYINKSRSIGLHSTSIWCILYS